MRRFFRYRLENKQGVEDKETVDIVERLMQQVNIKPTDRPVVPAARQAAERAANLGKGNRGVCCGAAIQLKDGEIVVGMNTPLLHAESAMILNAVKKIARIPEEIALLPENLIGNISRLKEDIFGGKAASLNLEEVLVALSISAATSPVSAFCLQKLKVLEGCDVHSTHVVGKGDDSGLRKLKLNLTTDALPTSRGLYY